MSQILLEHEITVDISKPYDKISFGVQQYDKDTHLVIVNITRNNATYTIPSGITPRIECVKPDGNFVYDEENVSVSNNKIQFVMSEQMCSANGTVSIKIAFHDDEAQTVLHTASFKVYVYGGIYSETNIESTYEFNVLVRALDGLQGVEEAEAERVLQENLRKEAELARASAETSRISSESTRVASETSRVSSEITRVDNEAQRIINENTRGINETQRVNAENIRVSSESSRQTAEANRALAELERVATQMDKVNLAKQYADSALESKNTVVANVDSAVQSASAAKTSETNAKNSETNSKTSENNSKTSETNAKNSELKAKEYAEAAQSVVEGDFVTNAAFNLHVTNIENILKTI